jgi:mono/diheme cytochrome c family protein
MLVALSLLSVAAAPALSAEPDKSLPRELRGPDGRSVALPAPEGGATALVFYSSECPISNGYSPTLNAIAAEFPRSTLNLVGVCSDVDLADADVVSHAKEFGLTFPVVRDRRGTLAAALGVSVTPEAVVVDARGKVRYRGRIDDQYAARQKRNANPRTHELRDAIAAVAAGREPEQARVEAVGCPLPEPPKAEARAVTYAGDVAAILQKHCQVCHRPGQVGPFPLMTYEQARKRATDIVQVVDAHTMPPWKAAPGFGPRFKNDKSLTDEEVAALTAWAEAGAPMGDPAALPPPAQFADDWALGTPDLILEAGEDFAIPAEGEDIYRCFVIRTNVPEDKYIAAIEYRPGNRKVVHHVLSYVDTTGAARKKDEAEPGLGYSCFSGPGVEVAGDLGGWAPGNEPSRLPDGVGRKLPSRADVVMQVHYHPSGKPETDRTRMGIYFARRPVRQTFHWNAAVGVNRVKSKEGWEASNHPPLVIPAGEARQEARGEWEIPVDVVARAVTPHMHMIGKDMTMTVERPDGSKVDLIRIDDWDFGWQHTYYFDEPIDLPKGSKLKVVAHFDNSDANPRNPSHPPREVHWGEATTDEMCIGFLGLTKKGQDLTRGDKDDLRDIFSQQRDDFRKKREEAAKASKKDRAKDGPGTD